MPLCGLMLRCGWRWLMELFRGVSTLVLATLGKAVERAPSMHLVVTRGFDELVTGLMRSLGGFEELVTGLVRSFGGFERLDGLMRSSD